MSPLALTPRTLRHTITYPRATADAYLVIEAGDTIAAINVPFGRTHVGRGFAADIELDDPTVSRRHAILIREEAGVRILDDRGENGVLVDGVPTPRMRAARRRPDRPRARAAPIHRRRRGGGLV